MRPVEAGNSHVATMLMKQGAFLNKENIMYDTNMGSIGSAKECKPDYEKVRTKQNADLTIIKEFKCSLIAFIGIIGRHSLKQGSIPELLGMVELDIIDRQKQFERTLEMIEKEK